MTIYNSGGIIIISVAFRISFTRTKFIKIFPKRIDGEKVVMKIYGSINSGGIIIASKHLLLIISRASKLHPTTLVQTLTIFSTVEPLNKEHFGDTASVLISEAVRFSEVKNVLVLW